MLGNTRIHFESINSTNSYAKQIAKEDGRHGTVITADFQTGGRGRLDRNWHAAAGANILASFIVHPFRTLEDWGGLPLLAGCAVAQTLRQVAGVDAEVKWPNDVMIEGRKITGILVESGSLGSRYWAVIGIGINVNQVNFDAQYRLAPTSLALAAGRTFDIEEVFQMLCSELHEHYSLWESEGNVAVIKRWSQLTTMLGRQIEVLEHDRLIRATAVGVAEDGGLLIRDSEGTLRAVVAGDVSISLPGGTR